MFSEGWLVVSSASIIVVGSILLACYAANDLGLRPAVGKYLRNV